MTKFGYYLNEHRNNNFASFIQKQTWEKPKDVALKWLSHQSYQHWVEKKSPLIYDEISFRDLGRVLSKLASGFLHAGIHEKEAVLILLPPTLHFYLTILALQKMGAIPIVVHPPLANGHLGKIIKLSSPKAMVSFDTAYQSYNSHEFVKNCSIKVCVGENSSQYPFAFNQLINSKFEIDTLPVDQDHTAMVEFKKHSDEVLGQNKTHRFLAAQHYAFENCLEKTSDQLHFSSSPQIVFHNLAAGLTSVIPYFSSDLSSAKEIHHIEEQIKVAKASHISLPSKLVSLLAQNNPNLPRLKHLYTDGWNLDITSMNHFTDKNKTSYSILYSIEEIDPISLISSKNLSIQSIDFHRNGKNYVGQLHKGLTYKFIKPSNEPIIISDFADWNKYEIPLGSEGELVVAGEHVCRDYYNNPDAFYNHKIKDDFGIIWHRTGIIAESDNQGNLWIRC